MALLTLAPPPLVRWLRLTGAGAVLLLLGGLARGAAPSEYQLKAVFLFNFAEFIEWPPGAFDDAQAPLVIGVLGEDPFGAMLDETVRDESVGQRKLVVQRYRRAEEITRCHILFISQSETGRLEPILTLLRGRNILTVCDTPGYALRGVMIRFVTDKNKIRLRINLEAARAAGLVISSKLLRPAEIVTSEGS